MAVIEWGPAAIAARDERMKLGSCPSLLHVYRRRHCGIWLTSVTDRQMDRHPDSKCRCSLRCAAKYRLWRVGFLYVYSQASESFQTLFADARELQTFLFFTIYCINCRIYSLMSVICDNHWCIIRSVSVLICLSILKYTVCQ